SELEYSRAVANRYKTEHQEIILKPDVLDILPSLVSEYGEPFADSSAIPTYYVSKAAREHVTVALTGDGGDELFGGYDIARVSYFAWQLKRWCPEVLRLCAEALWLRPGGPASSGGLFRKFRTLLRHASAKPSLRF